MCAANEEEVSIFTIYFGDFVFEPESSVDYPEAAVAQEVMSFYQRRPSIGHGRCMVDRQLMVED